MIVSLGTKNPSKVEGTRRAFSRYFPELEVRTVAASAGVPPQPLGLEQITAGAVSRARTALSQAGGDLGVGVEAGIFKMGARYFDHQQAAIVDPLGRVSLGHSAGYPLPAAAVKALVDGGNELEEYAVRLTGVEGIGDKGGLVEHLTKGTVTRADLTDQCVTMALVPLLHRDVYGPETL